MRDLRKVHELSCSAFLRRIGEALDEQERISLTSGKQISHIVMGKWYSYKGIPDNGSLHRDSNSKESDVKTEKEDTYDVSAEAETCTLEEGTNLIEIRDQIEEGTNSIEITNKIEEDANSIEIIVGEDPLRKAYENMHLDTIVYLLKAIKDDGKPELQSSLAGFVHPRVVIGADLLINAISAKHYSLTSELVQIFPQFASKVMMCSWL
ncbi:hypothetical protein L1987_64836 [Smallanthus sonchifolius]|uniref:Uncharacterized protein n=1 Tax=Smallanthus sonchifolius TaxID=185202 RepID=A0ACB9BT05_9ASTR|nr:hypothetical protein L1987_64836 [Smallanthus sonchifolius]